MSQPLFISPGHSAFSQPPGPAPTPAPQRDPDEDDDRSSREKIAAGPKGVVLPWFAPYLDNPTGETPAMRLAYRQMFADPNVKTAVLGKILSVAALDLQVIPVSDSPEDKQVADYIEWELTESVRGGVRRLAESLAFGALLDGYSVCEKVRRYQNDGKWKGKWALKKLKAKDVNNDLVIETDEYRNIVSVKGMRYNAGEQWSPGDFVIMQYLSIFESPVGMSDLRAAYSRWWMLDTVLKLRAMGLEKRALPMLIGHYATAQQKPSLEQALKSARSANWMSIPDNAKVEALEIAGRSDSMFSDAIKDLKHDIFLSIQGAILQALEGNTTGARSMGQVHQDTADLFTWYLARLVEDTLNDQVIPESVRLNFSNAQPPLCSLSKIDEASLESAIKVDSGLQLLGLKLSAADLRKRYGRAAPESPEDELHAQPKPGPGGAPAPGAAPPPGTPPAKPPAPVAGSKVTTTETPGDTPALSEFTDDASDVALAGSDGQQAEKLLRSAQKHGEEVLAKVTRSALQRYMTHFEAYREQVAR